MTGVFVALLTALAWAGSSTILKFLSNRIPALSLMMIRLWTGSVVLLVFVFLSGRGDALINTPVTPALYVIASAIIAIVIGDTLYIKSLSFLDISQAFPIGQCTFPIMVTFVAILFLGEPFSWLAIIGAIMVVFGVYLIVVAGKKRATPATRGDISKKGIILAVAASVAWTLGSVALKVGVANIDAFVAAAIRIPVSAIVLTGFVFIQQKGVIAQFKKYNVRDVLFSAGTGILTYGVAAVCYVTAIQLIGAAKTVLLTAVAPLLILPFSIFILKEKPTKYAIIGIFISVAGVYLVSI
ncbi:MAG: DMT family transporter [Dehalococcoidales bacterium]|nr:DMT family transporter [Dehalococcoidales bacterium]